MKRKRNNPVISLINGRFDELEGRVRALEVDIALIKGELKTHRFYILLIGPAITAIIIFILTSLL